ncbi:SRPBCC family protein [Paenibacillus sp. sgz500958]|uniref:SRPBCC family protein n=1 Tax=Paenibacillus sp. sgz500958 TaxID=3242475 RepID=UPI0036D30405
MIAEIHATEEGYAARFERRYRHSIEEVWAYLTDNDKLPLWFPELQVQELRIGGVISFDMSNGIFEQMTITDLQALSVLEYTWAEDRVRFELVADSEGCLLVLTETLHTITPHTPRDLAGWHVCLDVIGELLDGRTPKARKEQWNQWFEKYRTVVQNLK